MELLTWPLASPVGMMEVVVLLRKGREASLKLKSSKEPVVEDVRNSQRTGRRSRIQGGEVAGSG